MHRSLLLALAAVVDLLFKQKRSPSPRESAIQLGDLLPLGCSNCSPFSLMARPPPTQASPHCELCHTPAHVLCPSDDAFLCWRCDSMVHGANFLVARHHRTYLCSCCACPTALVANGAYLSSRSRLCTRCSISSAEVCCGTGSESPDSECSALTSDSEADSVSSQGSCSRKLSESYLKNRKRRRSDVWVPKILQDGSVADGMSDVDDELSSSGTLSPSSSYSRNDSSRSSCAQSRQGRRVCRFS